MRPHGGHASCCSRAAILLLLLVAVACSSLARPAAAASIISTQCPSGSNIVPVEVNSDLYQAFFSNGAGKTYVLPPGRGYTLSSQILIDGNRVGATSSVTCFIGGGNNRGDVVVTATSGITSNTPAFVGSSYASGAAVTVGIKGLTLNNGVNAAGFEFYGDKVGWSMQDVTVLGGKGGLYSGLTSKGELDGVAFEHISGSGVGEGPVTISALTPSTASYQWRDLTVAHCTSPSAQAVMVIGSGVRITIAGHVYMARNDVAGANSLGGALYVLNAQVTFTGDVVLQGNDAGSGLGGAAYIFGSTVRFAESSTLLVKGNQAATGGGGFYITQGSTVSVLGTAQFLGNTASGGSSVGGAVYAQAASLSSPTNVFFNAVCFSQNAASRGSGIRLARNYAYVTFNLPAEAIMYDNRPAASSISVDSFTSWTCSGPNPIDREQGEYDITGPICACEGPPYTCSCPDPSPGACACGVCEPGSGPCCTDAAQLAPCTRSIQLATYMQGSSEHYSSRQHYSAKHSASAVTVELAATVWDTGAQGSSAPSVNVPVSFAVHGDCAPDMAARSSITDAQGRAHARVTFSRPPGNVAVVAAVRSGGSLPSRVVTAVRHLKYDEEEEEPERSSYERDGDDDRTHRYGADGDDAKAYEAVATQMVLQALQEREEATQASVSGASV